MKKVLFVIGVYLILDGVISIYHFIDSAQPIEQFFRVVRAMIGVYLIKK